MIYLVERIANSLKITLGESDIKVIAQGLKKGLANGEEILVLSDRITEYLGYEGAEKRNANRIVTNLIQDHILNVL